MATTRGASVSQRYDLPFAYPVPPESERPLRAQKFSDLGWTGGPDEEAASLVALDVGLDSLCGTTFERGHDNALSVFVPTALKAGDAHAFRTLERTSFECGTHAMAFWPSDKVLRGYDGSLRLSSQIGLVEFPADHALAGLCAKTAEGLGKNSQSLIVTLPAFLPLDRLQRIRSGSGEKTRLRLFDRPSPPFVAGAYFYLYPSLGGPRVRSKAAQLVEWSDVALREGRLILLDWGASALSFGLIEVAGKDGTTELRQVTAGAWPSLGGHRLTLSIFRDLKVQLTDAILAAGPAKLRLRNDTREKGAVFRPPRYDEMFTPENCFLAQRHPRSPEAMKLRNTIFPTVWQFDPGEEPRGYAPLRKVAIAQFKKLWQQAEQIKKAILADPQKHVTEDVTWSAAALDSPFSSHLKTQTLKYSANMFLRRLHAGLHRALRYIDSVAFEAGKGKPVTRIALAGMQACSPVLGDTIVQFASGSAGPKPRALGEAQVAPQAESPIDLKSVQNRGAALLRRDAAKIKIGTSTDVLPFSIRIADCVGDIEIFPAGPVDELRVFQRRLHVDEGSPNYEFFQYESPDGAQQGSWGAIDFTKPETFTDADRMVAVDQRFRFGKTGDELPRFRKWSKDNAEIEKCFDRVPPSSLDGRISLRSWIPRDEPESLKLLLFIESELITTFRKKVFLLEREFDPPPATYRYVYQRYYLSRSQELIVVREWWAPTPENKLRRNKTLHVCIGSTEAKSVLGIDWGRH